MRTIVKPRENIASLWGQQCIKEQESYRLMKYVLRMNRDNKVLLHNVVTGHLVVLEDIEAEVLATLPSSYNPSMESLVKNHYLVPEDFDEYKSVNQLRRINQSRSSGDAINHYVILPTTHCNARCFYCYESDYPRIQMTEETARKMVDYIEDHRKGSEVVLSWFGGEPLVGIARIDQISQALADREIPFSSTMVSNGYLFDADVIERAVELWNLKRVQITLDGTEVVYNHVKAYLNAKDNPYQRVLRNIDLLAEKGIEVVIRLNVDLYNQDNIRVLIEELGEKYSEKKHVGVYLNMLFNDAGFEPVHHTEEEKVKLLNLIIRYSERLEELKLGNSGRKVPVLSYSQCMADNPHTVLIQPDGGFCRCEHESVIDSYGSLDKGIWDYDKIEQWKLTTQRSEDCPECCMYPFCYLLRNCMNSDDKCVQRIRRMSQRVYEEFLCSMYSRRLEEDNDETVCCS